MFKAPCVRRVGIVGETVLEIGGRAPQEKFVGIVSQVQDPRVGRRWQTIPPEANPADDGQPLNGSNRPPPVLWLKAHLAQWTPPGANLYAWPASWMRNECAAVREAEQELRDSIDQQIPDVTAAIKSPRQMQGERLPRLFLAEFSKFLEHPKIGKPGNTRNYPSMPLCRHIMAVPSRNLHRKLTHNARRQDYFEIIK